MKKTLLNILLIAFVIVCLTGKSWAFGSRHHSGGHNGSGDQGDFFSTDGSDNDNTIDNTFDNGENPFFNNFRHNDFIGNNDNGSNQDSWNQDSSNQVSGDIGNQDTDLPGAPVPEPMTLPLVGLGLVGIFLLQKMRSSKI
jgi:hypothetical protein